MASVISDKRRRDAKSPTLVRFNADVFYKRLRGACRTLYETKPKEDDIARCA
jgi:hypothetical protein